MGCSQYNHEQSELAQLYTWQHSGNGVALATVIQTWGSCPRPVGSHLAICEDGRFVGSVSGGCIEAKVITEAQAVINSGHARLMRFDVANEDAWEVGLTCGGSIQILVATMDTEHLSRLLRAQSDYQPVGLAIDLKSGACSCVYPHSVDGNLTLTEATVDEARLLLASGDNAVLNSALDSVFLRSYLPNYRLIVIGAVHVAQVLVPMAKLAGFDVTMVDPRSAFATAQRFPDTTMSTDWPDDALQVLKPDSRTAIVTLSHDPKIDDPALRVALNSPAYYIGCLGSRRTHAERVQRLTNAGLGSSVQRINAPVGLDLGRHARSPEDIAVAILAQIIACKGQPVADSQ